MEKMIFLYNALKQSYSRKIGKKREKFRVFDTVKNAQELEDWKIGFFIRGSQYPKIKVAEFFQGNIIF